MKKIIYTRDFKNYVRYLDEFDENRINDILQHQQLRKVNGSLVTVDDIFKIIEDENYDFNVKYHNDIYSVRTIWVGFMEDYFDYGNQNEIIDSIFDSDEVRVKNDTNNS
jgi:hypothetical protein